MSTPFVFVAGSPASFSSVALPAFLQNPDGAEVVKPMSTDAVQNAPGATGQPGDPAGQPPPQGNILMTLFPIILMFGLMYFLVMRPERKRQKEAATLRANLKKGDRVLLTSGMLGSVAAIADDYVTIEIADKVRAQFQKSAVAAVVESKEAETTS